MTVEEPKWKPAIKALLVHVLPALIVWGGLQFPMDRAGLAIMLTAVLTGAFDFIKEW